MRARSIGIIAVVCVVAALPVWSQTTALSSTASSVQALTVLQSACSALAGNVAINDITLTGTAERIVGSSDETGTATLRVVPSASRLDINLSSGTRSEIRNTSSGDPTGAWVTPDGVSHVMAYHNLLTDPGLFPLFTLTWLASSAGSILTYFGPETRNGLNVVHVSVVQQPAPASSTDAALLQHLSQVDIYLDSGTLRPTSLVFNIHPDDNALLDIPVEVRYSNYQNTSGVLIPLHVQQFINNSLQLDLQFQSSSLNTGLTAAQISAQ